MNIFKKYPSLTIFAVFCTSLSLYQRDSFFFILLLYVMLINFLLSGSLSIRIRKALEIVTWVSVATIICLIGYVNHYLPHGPMIDIGYDCTEYNDGRSTACGEQYLEDDRNLNIPDWAKFLRSSESTQLLLSLSFIAIVLGKERYENK